MAKPLIAAETIYDAALRLLDEQGADALSARNLARALECSTRTLYKQVGKREELIAGLVRHHLNSVKLEFHASATWQESARDWARAMRRALLAHPNLARLMKTEHREAIAGYVNELLKILLRAGFDEELALRCCRVLANVTLSLSLAEIAAPDAQARHPSRSAEEVRFEDLAIARSGRDPQHFQEPPEVFENTISWLVSGIEQEL